MTYAVYARPGVLFTTMVPASFRLLAALHAAAQVIRHDLTITSGTDGTHSGENDPHHRGEAYDVRTHDLPSPETALLAIMACLGPGDPQKADGGYVTEKFFGWVENAGQPNEHMHVQLRHSATYPDPPNLMHVDLATL